MKIAVFPNLGNTCYLSSVLQCFIYNTLPLKPDTPFCLELKKITEFVDLTKNEEHIANLYNLKDLVNVIPFKRFEQQDAHEFIIYFLDKLTELKELYYWESIKTIKCNCCGNIKQVCEDFNSINFHLNGKSIIDLFTDYLKIENHDDPNNLYYCEVCKKEQTSIQKISLKTLPKNLIIVLKKYNCLFDTKIDEVLKIKENGVIKTFYLKSVINHFGNLWNGHYTCSIKTPEGIINIDDNYNTYETNINDIKEIINKIITEIYIVVL